MTAYEIGYSGVVAKRATISAAIYYNDVKNPIFFRQVASYRASAPPPRWPLPPVVLELLILGNAFGPGAGLPSVFSYENLGEPEGQGPRTRHRRDAQPRHVGVRELLVPGRARDRGLSAERDEPAADQPLQRGPELRW